MRVGFAERQVVAVAVPLPVEQQQTGYESNELDHCADNDFGDSTDVHWAQGS